MTPARLCSARVCLQGVQLVKGVVKEAREKEIELQASRCALQHATACCLAASCSHLALPRALTLSRCVPLRAVQDGSVLPYGLCIWSTGVGPTPFVLRWEQRIASAEDRENLQSTCGYSTVWQSFIGIGLRAPHPLRAIPAAQAFASCLASRPANELLPCRPTPPCSLPFAKTPRGRLAVDDRLRVRRCAGRMPLC